MKNNFVKKTIITLLCITIVSTLLFSFGACNKDKKTNRFAPEITESEKPLELKGTFISKEMDDMSTNAKKIIYRFKFEFNKDKRAITKYNTEKGTVRYTYEIKNSNGKWEEQPYFYVYDKDGQPQLDQDGNPIKTPTRDDIYTVKYILEEGATKTLWLNEKVCFENGTAPYRRPNNEIQFEQYEDRTIIITHPTSSDIFIPLTKVK